MMKEIGSNCRTREVVHKAKQDTILNTWNLLERIPRIPSPSFKITKQREGKLPHSPFPVHFLSQ